VRHLEISGLDFRWTTQPWNLDVALGISAPNPLGSVRRATGVHPHLGQRRGHPDRQLRVRGRGDGHSDARDRRRFADARDHDRGQCLPQRRRRRRPFSDGAGWGFSHPVGVLDDVRIYRNHATDIGFRAPRYERGCTFDLSHAVRAHIAGNVVERSAAQAINVYGGKGATRGDVPLVRVLIHQNKAWKTMQNGNDFGGIESWQHGPVYIFNNLSFDARGQREGSA
jgi:hypothetical protein